MVPTSRGSTRSRHEESDDGWGRSAAPDQQREPVLEPAEHAAQRPLGQGGCGQLDRKRHTAQVKDDPRDIAGIVRRESTLIGPRLLFP